MTNDFSTVTACGECCTGCAKKLAGSCSGCIEADGNVPEWAQSGGCPIHKCARKHNVSFCGLCREFPCDWLKEKITWSPDAIDNLRRLADAYHAALSSSSQPNPSQSKTSQSKSSQSKN